MALPRLRSLLIASRSSFRRRSVVSWSSCAAHWNGVCGLGTNPPMRHGAPDVARPGGGAAGPDDVLGHLGDLEDVLVGLGRQPAHEVELHLAPAGGVGGGDGADQVVLAHHLVDDLAQPLAAALGGEGQPGAPAVAGELLGQVDVERVDPGAGQRQRGLGALVAVGEALGDLGDLGVVGAGERQQPDLLVAGGARGPAATISPMPVMERSRTGRVIMPAWQKRQPRVQPRKISTLIRSCTVSASGTSGCFG